MPTIALQIAVIVLLTLLNGFFAMSETALVSSRKARLRQRSEEGDRGANAALELAGSPNRFLSTVQIGISLIGVLAGAFGGATLAEPLADALRVVPALAPYTGPIAFGTVVMAITYLSLILGELVPKRLALNGAEAVASRVAGPMRLISVVTSPAVWFLSFSTEAVLRLLGVRPPAESPVTEQEVEILMEEGARVGVFEEEERDLVRSALQLDDRPVRELMTPRPRVVWLDANDPPEEVRRRVAESRHSYFPVARGDLDDLLGIASIKDAWTRQASGQTTDLLGSLRPSPFVPEGAPATDALESFKRSGLPLALVIDERGHIEGLITLTDVLEALVGEVPDEDEPTEEDIVRREDGSWLVNGLLAAQELKEHLGLEELPRQEDADYQTVGGMVMDALGRVPAEGDRFEREGYSFEVLDMDGRRVDKVLVTPAQDAGEAP
ncbi:MAG: hemolysin family protein [Actinomycetota bacterium]|jgi:magnesium and cobalt exporter, CNNM family|nr:hemolysin family protein [Actinomycetota bacterium]MDQ5828613.1 hemolysin family protein [Actinomycetota bacterium]